MPEQAARGRLWGPNIGSEDAPEDSNLRRRLAARKKFTPVSLHMQRPVSREMSQCHSPALTCVKGGEFREASAGRVRFDRIRQTSRLSANLIAALYIMYGNDQLQTWVYRAGRRARHDSPYLKEESLYCVTQSD